jgi:septal ring factor EnvC (AmiA/AmiB activator)
MAPKKTTPATDAIAAKQAELETLQAELSEAEKQSVSINEEIRAALSDAESLDSRLEAATALVGRYSGELGAMKALLATAPARLEKLRLEPERIAWVRDFDLANVTAAEFGVLVRYQKAIDGLSFYIAHGDAKVSRLEQMLSAAKAKHSGIEDALRAAKANVAILRKMAEDLAKPAPAAGAAWN